MVGLVLAMIVGALCAFQPMVGLACALILLLLALVIPRSILVVYGLTLLLPLVGGAARGAVIPFLRLGQAVLVIGCILFVIARPGRLGKVRLTALDLAFALYFLAGSIFPVLVLIYRGGHLDLNSTDNIYGVSPLQTLLGPLQYYLLYRIVVATISSEEQVKRVLELSLIASIIVAIIGILQKVFSPVQRFLAIYYPSITLHSVATIDQRITSTLESYSGLAAYLSFTIITALACYSIQQRQKISPLLLIATILLDSIALVLTGTLAAWIGLAIGIVVVFLLGGRIPKMAIFALAGIIIAVLIFNPFISARLSEQLGSGAAQGLLPQSFAFRIMLWKDFFFPAIGQRLLLGAGPDPAVLSSWSTEESQYLSLLLRGGLFYFFSYLLLIGFAGLICWRQIKQRSADTGRTVAIATLAILVSMSAMNVTSAYFTYIGGTQIIWTFLAMMVASGQLKALESQSALSQDRGTNNHTLSQLHRSYRHLTLLSRLLDWHLMKDSFIVGAGSMLARLLGLLFSTLLAHLLATDDFGVFRYIIGLVNIVTIAATASPASFARFLAIHRDDPQARDRYFSNGVVGLLCLLGASLLIAAPLLWFLHALNWGTISCIIGMNAFYGYLAVVRGLSSAWKMSLTYVLSNIALIIALFIFVFFFKLRTAPVAVAIYGLTNLVPICLLELTRPMILRFRPGLISKSVLLELARFAVPVMIAVGIYSIWAELDIVLVENFRPHAAGSYAAAKTLVGAFIIVPSVIAMVLMPRIAAMESKKSKQYCTGAALAALLISMIGLSCVYLWGHKLISLAFGQRYNDAYFPLLLQSIGMSIFSVYAVLESVIIGRGRPRLSVQAMLIALISTGISGFWLTPRLGSTGAGLAFIIGAVLGTGVMVFNTWMFLHSEQK